tara:strand:+ start:199 stop:369 length:171 start_codon:yes stop_codon:yes gene_type:complete
MAGREGLIVKFFEKWRQRKLDKLAKRALKNNPGLMKGLKMMQKGLDDLDKEFSKKK